MNDPGPLRLQIADLDNIEKAARGEVPCCAGCYNYWEDPEAVVRGWGWCRRLPPVPERMVPGDETGCPTVAYHWYCGTYKRGVHPGVAQGRKEKREEIGRAIMRSKAEGT